MKIENLNPNPNPIALIKSSVRILFANKVIMFPLAIVAFIQFLILEVLYFYPRFPVSSFMGPIIRYYFSDIYMHYPSNFILLPKLFQLAQMPIYVFISGFFIAATSRIILAINEDRKVKVSSEIKSLLGFYSSIILASFLSFLFVIAFFKGYGLLIKRASMIRSQSGIYFIIKLVVIYGAPYFNLLLSIIVSTLFAYIIPIIAIEKKGFFKSFILNFKMLFGSFWLTFFVVIIPSLLYVPVLILRGTVNAGWNFPEVSVLILVISIIVMFFIDVMVNTCLTTIYLIKKETK